MAMRRRVLAARLDIDTAPITAPKPKKPTTVPAQTASTPNAWITAGDSVLTGSAATPTAITISK
jgi:hypothetical protein